MIVLSYRINGALFRRRFENCDAALAAIRKEVLEDNGIVVKQKTTRPTKQEQTVIKKKALAKLTAEERDVLGLRHKLRP